MRRWKPALLFQNSVQIVTQSFVVIKVGFMLRLLQKPNATYANLLACEADRQGALGRECRTDAATQTPSLLALQRLLPELEQQRVHDQHVT